MADAADILGYPWFVSGEVIHGEKRGRDLGFPTATCGSIRVATCATASTPCGWTWMATATAGSRVLGGDRPSTMVRRCSKTFLFDFKGDLYGKIIDVAFIGWIRPEEKFTSIDDLVVQMNEDARQAKAMLDAAPGAFPPLGDVENARGGQFYISGYLFRAFQPADTPAKHPP